MATDLHTNLHSHSRADLSRNHKVLDELTSLVEATEKFTTSSAAASTRDDLVLGKDGQAESGVSDELAQMQSDPQINSGDSNADSERDSLASPASEVLSPEHPNDKEAREYRKKYPFGADLADNACRETCQNQFGGEEE